MLLSAGLFASVFDLAMAFPLQDLLSNSIKPRATGGKVANDAIAVATINDLDGTLVDFYRQYNGNGSIAAGWPPQTSWISFMDM